MEGVFTTALLSNYSSCERTFAGLLDKYTTGQNLARTGVSTHGARSKGKFPAQNGKLQPALSGTGFCGDSSAGSERKCRVKA
jgi:hypothetical protein